MQEYCLPLELIAFAIHPGSTESTTTICLDLHSSCLYLTSQSNLQFENVKIETIRELIDHLVFTKIQLISGVITATQCEDEFWTRYCVLKQKTKFRTKAAEKKFTQKITKIRKHIHLKLWEGFKEANIGIPQLERLKDMIRDVAVISDEDIFSGNAPEKTGFHGESRVVRFLFIRDYPAIHRSNTGQFFSLRPGERLSAEAKEQARRLFKADIRSHQIAMGSSQGTCADCGDCLDEFGIKHGRIGNTPAQWLDPLTMCGRQGGTTIDKPDSLHAIFVAFRSIVAE